MVFSRKATVGALVGRQAGDGVDEFGVQECNKQAAKLGKPVRERGGEEAGR